MREQELEIAREEDRITVAGILVKNGYSVTVRRRTKSASSKAVVYYLHVTDEYKDAKTEKGGE